MLELIVIAFACIAYGYWHLKTKRPNNYPPGPNWLPVVGNSPDLRKAARELKGTHNVFEQWMSDYNSPVLGLKLGNEHVVVALTYPMVRAVHTDEVYDGRPDNFFLRLRTMGSRLGITCTDGELWNEQRNFATRHLREAGYGRKPMDIQIQNELNELLDYIEANRTDAIWPGSIFPASVLSVLWTFTAGKRIARTDEHLIRLLHLLNVRSKAFDMAGGILNQMPILRHVAPEKTGFNLINRFNQEIHAFFMESIKAHHCDYDDEKANDDLIYAYIREMRANEGKPTTFTDLQLSMTILDIFIAGSQTTSITLDLAMMTLAIYPEIQKRIHKEMDEVLPNGQTPSPSDRGTLPYAEATLLEVQRFYHIVPISGPRRVMRETTLGGYTIPKNTTVLMGLRTVHMDKEHWGDPDVFRPERFLDENKKIINTEWLMPFGQGRRKCLGENLARSCLFTFFAGVVSRYRVVLPQGAEVPDRVLQPGITLSPKPYKVLFQKRF